jgi:hypothetical protein
MPPLAQFHPDLAKRGFLSFVFDGRYKFARYYAPSQFNPPTTLDQIRGYNDIELFDLQNDLLRQCDLKGLSFRGRP